MTDEEKFWFVVRELGDYAKKVPVTVLRAIQLIGLKDAEVLRSECEQLKQKVSKLEQATLELNTRVKTLETHIKTITPDPTATFRENIRRIRKEHILRTLEECSGNVDQACARLGIHKATMYRVVPFVIKVHRIVHEKSKLFQQKNYTGQVQSDTVQA